MVKMREDGARPMHFGQQIGGADVPGARVIEVRNPGRTAELVGTVVDGGREDAMAAVEAARAASTGWAQTSPSDRAAALVRIADALEADALAALVSRENGSALAITSREARGAAAAFRQMASEAPGLLAAQTFPSGDGGRFVRVERRPFGVVACIVPWNAPLILTANKIAPALASGNAVVLKPSPFAPLGVTRIGQIAAAALPPGTMNVVNGGAEAASALVDHRVVRKLSFTGGGATARSIMRQAADTLTPVHFELGGNDPAIVLDDADLSATVDGIVDSAFRRAGQVCFAVKRVYVPRASAEEFGRLLAERVDRIVVGDALDERASMGPLNNAGQLEKVVGIVDRATEAGRDVRVLGQKLSPPSWGDGYFLLPAVVLDALPDDELVREEQFGPVLPVVAYDRLDEAVEWANDTEYGLCSSVWSRDRRRALEVADVIEAGVTFVNSHLFSPTGTREIPFGGWKQSGIGWEGSPRGIDEYVRFHSVDVHGASGERGDA